MNRLIVLDTNCLVQMLSSIASIARGGRLSVMAVTCCA